MGENVYIVFKFFLVCWKVGRKSRFCLLRFKGSDVFGGKLVFSEGKKVKVWFCEEGEDRDCSVYNEIVVFIVERVLNRLAVEKSWGKRSRG